MPITKDVGRQYSLVARVPFVYTDFTSGVGVGSVDLPANSHVTGGSLVITTAFNSATSDQIEVGTATTAGLYLTQDVKTAAGSFAIVPTEDVHAASTEILLEWTGAGAAPSQGAGFLLLEYVITDRANENQ